MIDLYFLIGLFSDLLDKLFGPVEAYPIPTKPPAPRTLAEIKALEYGGGFDERSHPCPLYRESGIDLPVDLEYTEGGDDHESQRDRSREAVPGDSQ